MRLRSSAGSIAIIVDTLLGHVELETAALLLRIRPGTLQKILQEIEEARARRAGSDKSVTS